MANNFEEGQGSQRAVGPVMMMMISSIIFMRVRKCGDAGNLTRNLRI
jgi:hypothetical protein